MSQLQGVPLFIGSYSTPDQHGLHVCSMNCKNGKIDFKENIKGIENPSYLCAGNDLAVLYAVSEFKEGELGKVSAFQYDANGYLQPLTEVTYQGAGSCYVATDFDGQHLFVANYIAGSLVVLAVHQNSIVPVQTISFQGSGPHKERQEQSHIHAAVLSTDGTILYCTDLGADRLYAFNYNPENDQPLSPASPAFINLPPGCGPRHIACHPNGRWLYMLCELSGDLFVFAQGSLQNWVQRASVVQKGAGAKAEAADIQIDASGSYLYATNRGNSNQVIVFKIDEQTGQLTCIQYIPSCGKSPRSIAIDPTGRFLLVANEQENAVAVFRILAGQGKLSNTGQAIKVKAPTCLKFISRH